jgi:RNA polymerase sigma factor (sigma-70 family)
MPSSIIPTPIRGLSDEEEEDLAGLRERLHQRGLHLDEPEPREAVALHLFQDDEEPERDDGFVPDSSDLREWAIEHRWCCPGPSRRLSFLVSQRRSEKAWHYAYDCVDEWTRKNYRPNQCGPVEEWKLCIQQLDAALDAYSARSTRDHTMWREERAVPKAIDVVDRIVWYRVGVESSLRLSEKRILTMAEEYEASPFCFLAFPAYVNEDDSLSDRVRHCLRVETERHWTAVRSRQLLLHFSLLDDKNSRFVTDAGKISSLVFVQEWPKLERMVHKIIRDFGERCSGHEHEDLKQIGAEALLRAIPSFDCRSKFSTYACSVIAYGIIDYLRSADGTRRITKTRVTTRVLDRLEPSSDRERARLSRTVPRSEWDDPTFDAIWFLHLLASIKVLQDGDLLIRNALGYSDEELGKPDAVRQRRKRARDRLRVVLQDAA